MSAAPLLDTPSVPLDGGRNLLPRPLRRWVPVAVAFVGYPLLWPLGLGVAAYPLAGAAALVVLWRRRGPWTPLPAQLAVWFGFLLWTLTGLLVLGQLDRVIAYLYRSSMYVAATALLVLVVTSPPRILTDRTVLRVLTGLWFATVLGGLAALVAPTLELTTPMEALLPGRLLDNGLIYNFVHVQVADEARFLDVPVGRPEAPFPFTNAWGSNLALLTPVVLATWGLRATNRWRAVTGVLMVLSVAPLALSLNRGAWLSLGAGLVYVALRRVRSVSPGRWLAAAVVTGVVVVGALASPLGDVVSQRLTGPGHSDEGRTSLYTQAAELTLESPVVGHGAPQPNARGPEEPSIGTHGQLWLLLVSHGLPAAILYVAFFAAAWWAAFRWRAPQAVWLEAVLVVAAVQFPVYELLPEPTILLCVVAGLAIRGRRDQLLRDLRS